MNPSPLKVLSIITAVAVIQGAEPADAVVNMISVEHRVWGDAGGAPARNTYDESSSLALSRNVSAVGIGGYYASSSANDWTVSAYRYGDADYANGYAQNTYVFNPFSRELSISLNGVIGTWWFENKAKLTLTDLSDNSLVSSYLSPSYTGISPFLPTQNDMASHTVSWNTTLEVDPARQYQLIIYTSAHRGEGGDGSASLNVTLAPEPGTTLLSATAAVVLLSRRKRPHADA